MSQAKGNSIKTRAAVPADAKLVIDDLHSMSILELSVLGGKETHETVIADAIERSDWSEIVFVDDKPLAIFGAVHCSIPNTCIPWMVTTKLAENHRVLFIRNSVKFVERIKKYDHAYNVVCAQNTALIAWLKWLGFTVRDKPGILFRDVEFVQYEWRRK